MVDGGGPVDVPQSFAAAGAFERQGSLPSQASTGPLPPLRRNLSQPVLAMQVDIT